MVKEKEHEEDTSTSLFGCVCSPESETSTYPDEIKSLPWRDKEQEPWDLESSISPSLGDSSALKGGVFTHLWQLELQP